MVQPAAGIVYFEIAMVSGRLGAQADFLDLYFGLGFARLALFLFLFVKEFAEIHDAADGRCGVGGDLHQVELRLLGHSQGFTSGDHTHVFTCCTD